jgi:predicted nucleotidyltransferase
MTTPGEALERLRRAEASGELARFADRHGLSLIVVFGSAARGEPLARDLDVAVGSRTGDLDPVRVITGLMDLSGTDKVDLLDLGRAGPVARQHALVPGEPLYEHLTGEFARQQLRATLHGGRSSSVPLALHVYRRYVERCAAYVAVRADG